MNATVPTRPPHFGTEMTWMRLARSLLSRLSPMKERILLVDDDQDQCELLAMVLNRTGYDVRSTTSPLEALDLIAKESFSAILTDLGMGDMNGLELCDRIIGARPDVPVIVVTGNGSME